MNPLRKIREYAVVSKELDNARREANDLRLKANIYKDEVSALKNELKQKEVMLAQAKAAQGGISYSRVKIVKAARPEKRHLYVMALQKELKQFVQETPEEVYIEVLLPESNAQ